MSDQTRPIPRQGDGEPYVIPEDTQRRLEDAVAALVRSNSESGIVRDPLLYLPAGYEHERRPWVLTVAGVLLALALIVAVLVVGLRRPEPVTVPGPGPVPTVTVWVDPTGDATWT